MMNWATLLRIISLNLREKESFEWSSATRQKKEILRNFQSLDKLLIELWCWSSPCRHNCKRFPKYMDRNCDRFSSSLRELKLKLSDSQKELGSRVEISSKLITKVGLEESFTSYKEIVCILSVLIVMITEDIAKSFTKWITSEVDVKREVFWYACGLLLKSLHFINCRCANTVFATLLKLFGLRQSISSIDDIRWTSFAEKRAIIALTTCEGTWELPTNRIFDE